MRKNWIAVASADHVRIGVEHGFMQVGHGKSGPLGRIKPGDRVMYYSPTSSFGEKDGLQSFTGLGTVEDRPFYQAEMVGGFKPFRRDVAWETVHETPIRPLLSKLELTAGRSSWGQVFRYGLVQISEVDFDCIAAAMRI